MQGTSCNEVSNKIFIFNIPSLAFKVGQSDVVLFLFVVVSGVQLSFMIIKHLFIALKEQLKLNGQGSVVSDYWGLKKKMHTNTWKSKSKFCPNVPGYSSHHSVFVLFLNYTGG